jgi:gluconokinase
MLVVVMGVSATGKTAVGERLAGELGVDFLEGDSFHPQANIEKMSSGIPLTDEDRLPWLKALADEIRRHAKEGRSAVVTCSALRRSYREILARPGVEFVHLEGTKHDLAERLGRRLGHFMPASLLDSQLDTLEPLGPGEAGFVVDAALPVQDAAQQVLDWLAEHGTATRS